MRHACRLQPHLSCLQHLQLQIWGRAGIDGAV